jgi:RNA polymerase sigma-70 factor (ECF subfamily)
MRRHLRHPEPDPSGFEPTLRAARAGDLLAYNRLVLEHQDAVYNLAFRLLGDAALAAEATQAAFVGALRELHLEREWSFRMGLLRCLVQACRPRLGRLVPRRLAPAKSLPGCLASLPPAQRLALALVDIAGLDYAQAARVLGLAPTQVRCDLAAARQALSALAAQ